MKITENDRQALPSFCLSPCGGKKFSNANRTVRLRSIRTRGHEERDSYKSSSLAGRLGTKMIRYRNISVHPLPSRYNLSEVLTVNLFPFEELYYKSFILFALRMSHIGSQSLLLVLLDVLLDLVRLEVNRHSRSIRHRPRGLDRSLGSLPSVM